MFTAIVNFPIEKLQHNCHQKAFEMHQKNGLIADIVNPNIEKWELKELETELIKRVNFLFGSHSIGIQLAGNSVHFDLAFIKHHMPTFAKRLSYRILDMTTFRTIYTSLYPEDSEQPNPKHRARDDVLYSYGLMLDFIQKLKLTETCRSLN
jgi:oligoribonuclease